MDIPAVLMPYYQYACSCPMLTRLAICTWQAAVSSGSSGGGHPAAAGGLGQGVPQSGVPGTGEEHGRGSFKPLLL
jgi:hypothetical protein